MTLTEDYIASCQRKVYRPGVVASTDGYAALLGNEALTCAAVLMPLAWREDEWHLVFTRRTNDVEHHKGQVSFPGGGCDAHDTTPEQTALREAYEEIGLEPGDVRLLGRLNDVVTITRYRVTPVVGVMPWPYPVRPAPDEVARVFKIPLLWLADRRNWDERPFTPDGALRLFPVVRYHEYDGEVLWGATARMVQNLISAIL